MKLSHYDSGTLAEPEFSELEILKAENEFLRDELRVQELEKSLEIYEAIFDCIEKEGGVSSSLEIMFGENVSSKENMVEELKVQYNAAMEGLTSTDAKIEMMLKAQQAKARSLAMRAKKVMKYLFNDNYSRYDANKPIEVPISGIYSAIEVVTQMIVRGHSDNIGEAKGVQSKIADSLIGKSSILEYINDKNEAWFKGGTITIYDANEFVRFLQKTALNGPLCFGIDSVKSLKDAIKSSTGVDAKFWANYDDNKIKRLVNILSRGAITMNMKILKACEDKIEAGEHIAAIEERNK